MSIKFGTSGWRDIIAEGFTFENLRICTQAISEQIFKEKNHNKPVVVGYDTRFLSEKYAEEMARILANNGLEVRFSNRDVPTPVVAYEIIRSQSGAGLNITASHNPFNYNGLKFSTAWGGPALPETTHAIEGLCQVIKESEVAVTSKSEDGHLTEKLIHREDFRPSYIAHLKSLLDTEAFKKKKLKVVVDVFHGTGRGYVAEILRDMGCDVQVINESRDVYFEGRGPDPSTEGLSTMIGLVKKSKAHLGLATDGDADRFGVVDSDGTVISANEILSLLTRYLHLSRGWEGVVAKSVMTTHAINAVARKYGLTVKETPVGFKHIGEVMKEADSILPSTEGEFVMGAEESGGFTMRGHVPEKDGILACLLVAEMTAETGQTIKEQLKDLYNEIGVFLSRRINIHATPEIVSALRDQFATKPPVQIDGLHVQRIVDLDGFKFVFHGGSWLGVRFSGTEPIVRLYLEASSEEQLKILQKAGESLIHPHKKSSR
ncbi:MAG: Phosphoglucomutase [Elusimicrobia bacterium]|nr:Phosphoglucomutase [Elusimicrobiota bacterium]